MLIRSLCTTLVLSISLAISGASAAEIPRTPDGRPDLQGVWANINATPLERPEQLSDKAELTDEEVAELEKRHDLLFNGETDAAFGDSVFEAVIANDEEHESYDPETGNYNHFWVEGRTFENRTSLIVDPPNGRIPPLTPEAQARDEAHTAYVAAHPADSYTDRLNSDRCITFGAPFIGAGYNGYFQIAQTPDTIVVMQEMAHESRIIPLDNRPQLDAEIRNWIGEPRGHWEGDTLVVETRNFSSKSTFLQSSENLNLTERYTLVDADTLQWSVRIEDDSTWTQPWTLVINLKKSDDPIYEYACHEGNLAMEGILGGHRAEEAEALAVSGGGKE